MEPVWSIFSVDDAWSIKKNKKREMSVFFVTIFLFTLSTILMLGDLWPELDIMRPLCLILILLIVYPAVLIYYATEGRRRVAANLGATAAYGIAAVVFLKLIFGREFSDGLGACMRALAGSINKYYKLNLNYALNLNQFSKADRYIPYAMVGGLSLALLVLLYLALVTKKPLIIAILPGIVFSAGMLVGLTPGIYSILPIIMGIALSGLNGYQGSDAATVRSNISVSERDMLKYRCRRLAVLTVVVFPILAAILLDVPMRGVVEQLSDTAKDFQESLEQKIKDRYEADISDTVKHLFEDGSRHITNRTPKYKEKTVGSIFADNVPDILYLADFYAGEYSGGKWVSGLEKYEKENVIKNAVGSERRLYEKQGEYPEYIELLLGNTYKANYMGNAANTNLNIRYEVGTGIAFRPTILGFCDYGFVDFERRYIGEGLISGEEKVFSLSYKGWYIQPDTLESFEDVRDDTSYSDWYESYVRKNYCRGSSEVPSAQRIAERIKEYYSDEARIVKNSVSYDDKVSNKARYTLALAVSRYLSTGAYSTELSGNTKGKDCVEYFLKESQVGYCEHYASAGVLILQSLDVPARYMSGYVIDGSRYSENMANVLDSDAHAWVQVFLDGVGWVDVEMTPGYDNYHELYEEELKKLDGNTMGCDEPTMGSDTTATTTREPSSIASVSATEGASSYENRSTEIQTTGPVPSTTGQAEKSGGDGEKSNKSRDNLVFTVIILIMLVTGTFIFARNRGRKKVSTGDVRRDELLALNKSLYKRLSLKKSDRHAASDKEYVELLIRAYVNVSDAEWKKYMRVLQKALFSDEPISGQEYEYCKNLVKKVRKR